MIMILNDLILHRMFYSPSDFLALEVVISRDLRVTTDSKQFFIFLMNELTNKSSRVLGPIKHYINVTSLSVHLDFSYIIITLVANIPRRRYLSCH